jgi:hypothetical protein
MRGSYTISEHKISYYRPAFKQAGTYIKISLIVGPYATEVFLTDSYFGSVGVRRTLNLHMKLLLTL